MTPPVEEFVSHSECDSSDNEDSGYERRRRRHLHNDRGTPPPDTRNVDGNDQAYLNGLIKCEIDTTVGSYPYIKC